MGNNFFRLLRTAITQRFSFFLQRFRNLTNLARLKNLIYSKIVLKLRNLLDVKPKDKDDYYTIFSYMVSKRLAYLLVVVIGVLCGMFVYNTNKSFFEEKYDQIVGEERTYNYNSMLLRMAKGKVRIKAKSGYVAYEGDVEKGYAAGAGTLYDKDGGLVYVGNFANSMYEGMGIEYYPNGTVWYNGEFSQNLFHGVGKLYRKTGSLSYSGEFVNGLREGNGELYDKAGNKVYTGRFAKDFLLYSELLGKTASEVNSMYIGSMNLYTDDDVFAVHMPEIDAIYAGLENDNALEDEVKVDRVYVLSDEFPVRNGVARVPSEITEYLGEPIFEGTSYITEEEAIAMNLDIDKNSDLHYSDPGLELNSEYDDYFTVKNYDADKMIYLYTYLKDGIEYNFVCSKPNSTFGFYYMTQEDASAVSDDEEEEQDL